MRVSDEDAVYVAELAKLNLSEVERQNMIRDLDSILGYIDLLSEVDTTNIPPMIQITPADRRGDAMRGDELLLCLPHEVALKNAPNAEENVFKVPKVIEK